MRRFLGLSIGLIRQILQQGRSQRTATDIVRAKTR